MLFVGVVEVNALAKGALWRFIQWNTTPSNSEACTLSLSYSPPTETFGLLSHSQ